MKDLYVLDLTLALKTPSIFSGRWGDHGLTQFIHDFVDEISQPVTHDGTEHTEYVPTQVISEFFAQAFKYAKGRRVDGILFPSSLVAGAQNLVLFPRWGIGSNPDWAQLVLLTGSEQLTVAP